MKTKLSRTSQRNRASRSGFALVATLALMILLMILAVGLLSLSAVTLRSSGQAAATAEARANARMALLVAIGELQKHAGADTRITAPSNIIEYQVDPSDTTSKPRLLGAWRSWEGTDHETTGRPVSPVYSDKEREESEGGRFLTWLISGATASEDIEDLKTLNASLKDLAWTNTEDDPVPPENYVALLGEGTLGEKKFGEELHVEPQLVNNGTGRIAWWVSGENQKARLPKHYEPTDQTAAAWSDIAKSHAVADPIPFGLEQDLLVVPSPADKAITSATANLVAVNAAKPPSELFHDLSVSSVGLLTNTATGGWRKDMSVLAEKWDAAASNAAGPLASLPEDDLPLFRLLPDAGATTGVSRPTLANIRATQSVFYPWIDYRTEKNSLNEENACVVSWGRIMDYVTSYKRVTFSGGQPSMAYLSPNVRDKNSASNAFDFYHKPMISPIVGRIHWLFSHRTTRIPNGPGSDDDTFRLDMLLTPVLTMWNPFNVAVTTPAGLRIRTARPLPCALQYYDKDGNPLGFKKLTRGPTFDDGITNQYPRYSDQSWLDLVVDAAFTLPPGDTRVFSPIETKKIGGSRQRMMQPGFRLQGFRFENLTTLDPDDAVQLDLNFDVPWKEVATASNNGTVGMYLDIFKECIPEAQALANKHVLVFRQSFTRAVANTYWPPISHTEIASPQAFEIENTWRPVFSVVYGSRVSGPSSTGMPGKGVMQTNPATGYARQTLFTSEYKGATHPVNATSDFSFYLHTGNDDKLPNAQGAPDYRGFLISGFTAGDGLNRLSLLHMPLRPVASIIELQNMDLKAQNGVPPYQLNIIGNSDASPLLPSNDVINQGLRDRSMGNPAPPLDYRFNLQHDDSYCANHLLMDDWFLSSIAPAPSSFGSSIHMDMEAVHGGFLAGTTPLVNRSYIPIAEDQGLTAVARKERYDDLISPDGWQRSASRIEVIGMFNVNSTSEKAWRALLRHARNQKIPHFNSTTITTSASKDHAMSRAPVASDGKAGEAGISGVFPESSEFSGFRVFTDVMLDDLAAKVVEQIRLRGPFLSLSEFVNRQLATGNLALAGAVQAALNQMGGDPHQTLKQLSLPTVKDPPGVDEYQYRDAAEGFSSYGLPGWIRQADVLRPLAPILSVRDDTFTIRAYGDSRDASGKILARSWCEATVRRSRDFVDPTDAPDRIDAPVSPTNIAFGRKFEIISFRWLHPSEV